MSGGLLKKTKEFKNKLLMLTPEELDDYFDELVGAIKRINEEIKSSNEFLKIEPCCKWNVPSDEYYCAFHKLVNKLKEELGGV